MFHVVFVVLGFYSSENLVSGGFYLFFLAESSH